MGNSDHASSGEFAGQAGHSPVSAESENHNIYQYLAGVTVTPSVSDGCKPGQGLSQVTANGQPPMLQVIATLSKMKLRKRFKAEANCHRAMLQRRNTHGAVIHPDFLDFRSFLSRMGPMPAHKATVDRIDSADPEYAPGKVRWADKLTQTRNRQNTVLINLPDGSALTPEQLAPRLGVSPATIRKQRSRKWTDDEILQGKRAPLKPPPSDDYGAVLSNTKAVQKRSDGSNRQRGWWHSIFSQFEPSGEEIAIVEDYLRSRRLPPMSRKQEEAEELRERFRLARRAGEPEPLPATLEAVLEITNERFGPPTLDVRTRSDRRAAKEWPRYKPHVDFQNLEPAYVMVLRRIDPSYVEEQEARSAAQQKLRECL